ncbi:MAG: HD domain-containing phosphohydrolase [Pseudomonadota bacterium]
MSLELKRVLFNISSLGDLGQEVTSENNFSIQIRSVLYVIMGTFLAVKGAILFFEKEKGLLSPLTQKGFDSELPFNLPIGLEWVGNLERNRAYILGNGNIPDIPKTHLDTLHNAGAELFVPLWTRDEFVGALVLSKKFSAEPYTSEDFELLKVISNQIAITLNNHALFIDLAAQLEENRRLYEEMRLIYHDTIQAFAAAIDAKDAYTKHHSYRVAKYVVAIARELGWEEEDIEGMYIAGLLHDVGKIILRDEVLNKKSPLSKQEREELRKHSSISYDIISKIKFPWKDVVSVVRHHHERVDGNGYPDAINSKDLSNGEKILTLADAFDAMTTDRPYRQRMSLENALEELKRCVGTQFDPKIMGSFCKVLEREINSELPSPDILPHIDKNFDPSIINSLLRVIIEELTN